MSAVVQALDEAWEAVARLGDDPPPQLVTVRPGVPVALLDLGFDDPLGSLVGLHAPPDADAVGIATGGWALPPHLAEADLDRGRMIRPSSHPEGMRVRTLVVLDRRGIGASRLRIACGAPLDTGLPDGFATDVLRRTLSLPTPPPGVPVDELLAVTWLHDIAVHGHRLGRRLAWEEAVSLRICGVASWEDARWAASAGCWPELRLSTTEALWMDDGIFARWCLGRYRSVPDLVLEVRRFLRASAFRQLRAVVTPLS